MQNTKSFPHPKISNKYRHFLQLCIQRLCLPTVLVVPGPSGGPPAGGGCPWWWMVTSPHSHNFTNITPTMAFKTGGSVEQRCLRERYINGTTIISLVHYNDYKRQLRRSLKSRQIKGKSRHSRKEEKRRSVKKHGVNKLWAYRVKNRKCEHT